ncbi:MAG: hypothetical protein OXE51_06155 [Gammaproteobacteria bacterium]|nr:hypothetical protein [Gammaproteobacteria bacterium]
MLNGQPPSQYRKNGVAVAPATPVEDYLVFLREQLAAIYRSARKVRPWLLWELHNPWSRSASVADSWKFLELCQSKALLSLITPFIGEDIILFDSQFSPDLGEAGKPSLQNDRLRCPAEPLRGLVVRIPFAGPANHGAKFICKADQSKSQTVEYGIGSIVCHNMDLDYQVIAGPGCTQQPFEYVIRYFPATSLYLRDPTAKPHIQLTERLPLLNYAQMPLWLVQGEDKAGNDFATGFQPKAGRWISRPDPPVPAASG